MPGAFDRLMRMAERQLEASIDGSSEARTFIKQDNQRGQYLGFAVTVLALLGAIFCAYLHQPVVAGLLVGVPVLAVAKALIESAKPKQAAVVVPVTQPAASSPPPLQTGELQGPQQPPSQPDPHS